MPENDGDNYDNNSTVQLHSLCWPVGQPVKTPQEVQFTEIIIMGCN